MERLTRRDYWNDVYGEGSLVRENPRTKAKYKAGLKGTIKQLLSKHWRNYSDYLEWDVIYEKHFPKTKGLKIIEIGSAPGHNLVRLHQVFGYEPYGVEYAEAGANLNREVFEDYHLDPDNVIQADAFSESFLSRYEGAFDLVISRGFIEHFTDMDKVLATHLRLLKPGGKLIVTIPRLTGVPNLLFRLFNPTVIPMHNLDIMNKRKFESLFSPALLEQQYCDYYGTFRVNVCWNEQLTGLKATALNGLMNAQLMLNLLFRMLLGQRGAESYWFSPYLIYIGTKKKCHD